MQTFPVTLIAEPIFTSGLLMATLLTARYFLTRAVRNRSEILNKEQRRWLSRIRNGVLILLILGLILIWAPQLRTLALSLAAVAVALVVATKEMILCLSGAFMRASTRPFVVGDWITIDGISGEVIDVNPFSFRVQEIDMAGKTYQLTGHTIEIPNSRFFTSTIENLNFNKSYLYHDINIAVPVADSDPSRFMDTLQNIVTEHYAPLLEAADSYHQRMIRKSGTELPSIQPQFGLRTSDLGHHIYNVRLFIPTRDIMRLSQTITVSFLSAVHDRKNEKSDSAIDRESP